MAPKTTSKATPSRRRTAAAPDPNERMTASQCAEGMNIKLNTFWGYVSRTTRQHFPSPDGHDDFSGKPFWYRRTYEAAVAARPGAGSRTDLQPAAPRRARRAKAA